MIFSQTQTKGKRKMTIETANRLYELRKKNNLSQEELAEKLGVSRQAVSKWERSEASPDTDNLIALAKIYGLSLDELIYGEKGEKSDGTRDRPEQDEAAESTEAREDVYIDIEGDGDKVKIGPDGILVEEKNGNVVKIGIKGKILQKVMDKVVDYIEINEDDCDGEGETVLTTENGHIKLTVNKSDENKRKRTSFWLKIPYPVICVLAYLAFGFYDVCGGWALSWVIFVTVPVYYSLVNAIYNRRFSEFAYPVFAAFAYLVCGMYLGNWHPSWLIFLSIPVYYPIAEFLDQRIGARKKSK